MGIENIIGKILAEAEADRAQLLTEAEEKSRQHLKMAQEQAEKIRRDGAEQAKEEAQLIKSRKTSLAELEARKMRLGAKQALISRCFDEALEQMANNMEEEDYLEFLSAEIIAANLKGGELLLNARDRRNIGKKLVKKVNDFSPDQAITLAEDTIAAKGGFILRKGSIEMNATLEALINNIRESAAPEVAKELFEQ